MKREYLREAELKKRILNLLTSEAVATTMLSKDIGSHYYRIEKCLNELETEGLVEKIKVNKYSYWKKKGVQNEEIKEEQTE